MILQLKPSGEQTRFNLQRWAEVLADPELAKLPHRIETDRHGHIIMSPPSAPSHGSRQAEIIRLFADLMPHGNSLSECPLSTSDGVKAIDVAWISADRSVEARDAICLTCAPEICVEILSPSNTEAEILEKKDLYLEAGAQEVWLCGLDGRMTFHAPGAQLNASIICLSFPHIVPAFPVH
jgi:Uma2 family endonuclease